MTRCSTVVALSELLLSATVAGAQTANKGLETPQKSETPTTGTSSSGSGTSTSGGKDANGNQGRDAMPESNITVKPLDQQGRNPNGSPK